MYDSMREMYLMMYIIRLYYKKIINDTHEDIAKVVILLPCNTARLWQFNSNPI